MNIEFEMTSFSQVELNNILYKDASFEEALRYLNEDIRIRTFQETLSFFCKNANGIQTLIDSLFEIERSVSKDANRDSIARKVRSWMSDKSAPDNREELLKICFAFGLSENAADAFLSLTTDGGFHLRSPRELAFAYSLRTGKSYDDAVKLVNSLKPIEPSDGLAEKRIFTKTIADLFGHVRDDRSFHEFYAENYDALGIMHNTAYYKCFMPLLNTLICPHDHWYLSEERKYSVEEVVNVYLRMNIPSDKKTSKYTALQKTIRKYWPNTSSVTRMRNREEDVTRKILLLLYLVTGGRQTAQSDDDADAEGDSAEQFETHFWKINAMMADCGMSRLDPRSMFDWLILYCLKTSGDELMSDRLQIFLRTIFEPDMS